MSNHNLLKNSSIKHKIIQKVHCAQQLFYALNAKEEEEKNPIFFTQYLN